MHKVVPESWNEPPVLGSHWYCDHLREFWAEEQIRVCKREFVVGGGHVTPKAEATTDSPRHAVKDDISEYVI